jgi:hypothetical protein
MKLVKKLINKPVDSNTYIFSDLESKYCLIIDPGYPDISKLITLLTSTKLQQRYYLHMSILITYMVLMNY